MNVLIALLGIAVLMMVAGAIAVAEAVACWADFIHLSKQWPQRVDRLFWGGVLVFVLGLGLAIFVAFWIPVLSMVTP